MGKNYLDVMAETYVVFVPDLGRYWGALKGRSGWEALSPVGEIRAFLTEGEARTWRLHEVASYVEEVA